jgi:hypothetical protein
MGLFCNHCFCLIAAVPQLWSISLVVISPFLIALGTSYFRAPWILLLGIDLAVLTYLWFALRDIGTFWYFYPFLISVTAIYVYSLPVPFDDDIRAGALATLFV